MRKRFPFPSEIEGIPADWKRFLKFQFDDLYPAIQGYTPAVVNVFNPDNYSVTSDLNRMGRMWQVSFVFDGPSTCVSGYLELPFVSYSTNLFLVKVDIDPAPKTAYVDKNTSRLYLPDWSSSSRVIISGTAGE